MRSPLIACAALALAGACSTDPPPALLDAAASDAPAAQCLIPASYGALGDKTGTADLTIADSLTVVLDPGPPRDDLFVKLIAGQGAFAGGIKTGSFTIAGADAAFTTCGLCVSLIADIVSGQGPSKFYFADAGTITLTSATPRSGSTPSQIAGTAQNLHFIEVDAGGAPVAGGCSSTLGSIGFSP
ncbi:MAG TPA: hypothetical protein VFT22_00780 [Kofleriaceae bacterium]|nr:hypothetical protein [Kofleriaceae bacterium]